MPDPVSNAPEVIPFDARDRAGIRGEPDPWISPHPQVRQTLHYIERVACSEASLIIYGESGTGKELLARQVHQLSGRRGRFVAVNCGAINEQLAESELFGHEAGAFTGANGRRCGWFEAANHGTLFLDEVGELPKSLQVKLLRALQEREVVRVGSRQPIPLNIRIIAATNVDLDEALLKKEFRRDLYFRLNVFRVTLTPLRERSADITPLAQFFLQKYSSQLGLPVPVLTGRAQEALTRYHWPGNIRELENLMHAALLLASGQSIDLEHLRFCIAGGEAAAPGEIAPATDPQPRTELTPLERVRQALRDLFATGQQSHSFTQLEDLILEEAYLSCRQNQKRTAALLGISRNMLRSHLGRQGNGAGRPELPIHQPSR